MVRHFTYFDLTLRVEAEVASHLDWLTEFLCPFFELTRTDRHWDAAVVLRQDTSRFEELLKKGPVAVEQLKDSFALDNSVIALPVWNDPDEWLTLYEEKFRTFFRICEDRRRVEVLGENVSRLRTPAMRVVREFTMNHLMQDGGLFLHASAVAFQDQGLLIVGTKNAGKTSLLTHFLRHDAARYVSNDRTYVTPGGSPLQIRGMPTLVTVRSGMLAYFEGLERNLENCTFHHSVTLEESKQRNQPPQRSADGRYCLTPAQFLSLTRATAQAQTTPRALLFPRVTNDAGTIRARSMGPQEAARRMPDALFGVSTWRNQADVFNLSGAGLPTVEELLNRCQRVATALPCFEVELGTQAYTSACATDDLLNGVLAR